jgi:hypothetical protein
MLLMSKVAIFVRAIACADVRYQAQFPEIRAPAFGAAAMVACRRRVKTSLNRTS